MVGSHHLLEAPFRYRNVALGGKPELNRLSFCVHRTLEILTSFTDLDLHLIDSVRRAAHLQVWTNALVNFGRVSLHPTEERRVLDRQAALAHHLGEVAVGELRPAVPTDTK